MYTGGLLQCAKFDTSAVGATPLFSPHRRLMGKFPPDPLLDLRMNSRERGRGRVVKGGTGNKWSLGCGEEREGVKNEK